MLFPFKFPDLFSERQLDSQFEVPAGFLLYGAPGNGKTKIARCLAAEATGCTFVSVSGADIKDMWVGETEKKIKALFEMANELRPTILLIDEAESLFMSREGASRQYEIDATCQFLSEMQEQKGITVVACTNYPWLVDKAIRRRLTQHFHVQMPDCNSRGLMLKYHLRKILSLISDEDYLELAKSTENYSCSDIHKLAKLCGQSVVQRVSAATHFGPCLIRKGQLVPCEESLAGAQKGTWNDFPPKQVSAPVLTYSDVSNVLKTFHPSANQYEKSYLEKLKKFEEEK